MKVKVVVVLSVVFLLCGLASAQAYLIRTDNVINLRTGYSLEADVFETAPSGTILQVVGKFNRWFKINRNGSEVWMADWVDYSRVGSGQSAATSVGTSEAAPSVAPTVDNCCGIDRQCQSDQEWVNGYYDYQNHQCSAAPMTSTAAVVESTSQPAVIDNLCYTVRTCHTQQDWINGYHAFHAQQSGAVEGRSQTETETSAQVTWVQNCTHARSLGLTNIPRGHPAYRSALDRDNDGFGCDS